MTLFNIPGLLRFPLQCRLSMGRSGLLFPSELPLSSIYKGRPLIYSVTRRPSGESSCQLWQTCFCSPRTDSSGLTLSTAPFVSTNPVLSLIRRLGSTLQGSHLILSLPESPGTATPNGLQLSTG